MKTGTGADRVSADPGDDRVSRGAADRVKTRVGHRPARPDRSDRLSRCERVRRNQHASVLTRR